MLHKNGVECQVYDNSTSETIDETLFVTTGFYIKLINITGTNFKELVWDALKDPFVLNCAYVNVYGGYSGCIKDWPNVFTKSKCIGKT